MHTICPAAEFLQWWASHATGPWEVAIPTKLVLEWAAQYWKTFNKKKASRNHWLVISFNQYSKTTGFNCPKVAYASSTLCHFQQIISFCHNTHHRWHCTQWGPWVVHQPGCPACSSHPKNMAARVAARRPDCQHTQWLEWRPKKCLMVPHALQIHTQLA